MAPTDGGSSRDPAAAVTDTPEIRSYDARPVSRALPGVRAGRPRPGEYDVRRIVLSSEHPDPRPRLATLIRSRGVLIALATVVILALAGTTYGYAALSKTVTLTVDGQDREVTAMGGTVGDVLDDRGHRDRRPRRGPARPRHRGQRRQPDQRPVRPPARADRRRRLDDPLGHLDRRRLGPRRDRPALLRRGALHEPLGLHRPRRHGARDRHPQAADARRGRQEADHQRDPGADRDRRARAARREDREARHREAGRRSTSSRTATRSSSPTCAS